jgi:DNA-binding MarR family transcriptional regulator
MRSSSISASKPARPELTAPFPDCNCLALRQATRHVTQFYDQHLASAGLRTTQFSILGKLRRLGPMSINALARELVMDRTTLGRTMLPLERDGLIRLEDDPQDRRSKRLAITEAGTLRLRKAAGLWLEAQNEFERRFGADRAAGLRALLGDVVSCDLDPASASSPERRMNRRAKHAARA